MHQRDKKDGQTSTKSAQSSTISTGSFSARELCAIIRSCSEYGVKGFKLGNLELSFKHDSDHDFAYPVSRQEVPHHKVELTEDQIQAVEIAKRNELLASDPMAFEKILIDETLYGESE